MIPAYGVGVRHLNNGHRVLPSSNLGQRFAWHPDGGNMCVAQDSKGSRHEVEETSQNNSRCTCRDDLIEQTRLIPEIVHRIEFVIH